jgi:hypothetical protein
MPNLQTVYETTNRFVKNIRNLRIAYGTIHSFVYKILNLQTVYETRGRFEQDIRNLHTIYGTIHSSVYNMLNLQTVYGTTCGFVQKKRNLFGNNETNSGSGNILRNYLPFHETIRGLVLDTQNHKGLAGTYEEFRCRIAKPCETY